MKAFLHKPLSFRLIFTDIFPDILNEEGENEAKGFPLEHSEVSWRNVSKREGAFCGPWVVAGAVATATLAAGGSYFVSHFAPGHELCRGRFQRAGILFLSQKIRKIRLAPFFP